MKSIDQWLIEYHKDHKNPTNQLIHKVCVPAIVFSLVGLLFCIPFPISVTPGLERMFANWAAVFAAFAMLFYIRIAPRFAPSLFVLVLCMLGFLACWERSRPQAVLPTCGIIFFVAWVGQFIGHRIEGQKPSFFKDLQFLLIGPLWVLGYVLNLHPQTQDRNKA